MSRLSFFLVFVTSAAFAQFQNPPQEPVDLRQGEKEPQKLCTRDVFYPCPDERSPSCTRKETYRC
jgi:hypothetical protein